MAISGYTLAFDKYIGKEHDEYNGYSLWLKDQSTKRIANHQCNHRNVTIRDVHFGHFMWEKYDELRKIWLLLHSPACEKDPRACEERIATKISGYLIAGSLRGFKEEVRYMYFGRYGFAEMNKQRIQIFAFQKLDMRNIRIDGSNYESHNKEDTATTNTETNEVPEVGRLQSEIPVEVGLRYVENVFLHNVSMFHGGGIGIMNVDSLTATALNVIDSEIGINFFCLKDYGDNSSGKIGCTTGQIYGAITLNASWAANKSFEMSKFKFKIPESSNFRTF